MVASSTTAAKFLFLAQVHPGMQEQFKKRVEQLSIPLVQRKEGPGAPTGLFRVLIQTA